MPQRRNEVDDDSDVEDDSDEDDDNNSGAFFNFFARVCATAFECAAVSVFTVSPPPPIHGCGAAFGACGERFCVTSECVRHTARMLTKLIGTNEINGKSGGEVNEEMMWN